jgi:hypothetical protein
MSKPGRLWFPLDVAFWEDPDIIGIGEASAVLFQRLVAYSKQHQLNGLVPAAVVRSIGGRRWREKFAPLVSSGLVQVTDSRAPNVAHFGTSLAAIGAPTWCQIVAYLAWNDSSDAIEERRRIANEKKRSQRDAKANVPQGQTPPVPGHRVEIETEVEKTPSESAREATGVVATEQATTATVRAAFARSYEAHRGSLWNPSEAKADDVRSIAAWVDQMAAKFDMKPADVVDRILRNFWADDFGKTAKRPWDAFRSGHSSYWDQPAAKPQPAAPKYQDPSRRTGVLDR